MKMNMLKDTGISSVKFYDPYMTNAFERELDYLIALDPDRLLAGFRETAGLDMKGKERYEGWENMLIGGHTLGHYMTALAQASVSPNASAEKRAEFKKRLEYMSDELLICQKNSKGKKGFIFGAKIVDKDNVEAQFDNVEKGKTDIFAASWVPWYTLHKIIAGLIDSYRIAGVDSALEVASSVGDWTYERMSALDEKTHRTVLDIEFGGMNDCLYDLYKLTGKPEHAAAAHMFDDEALYESIMTKTEGILSGKHANTTIPKFIGALNRYRTLNGKELFGEKINAERYLEYAETFFDLVVDIHTYITGGNSEWEHFRQDHMLDHNRTNCNCETCNVYNMLKLSRELYKITENRKYPDFYERAYINQILSSQNPETGMTTYFQAMATGYFKTYSEPFTKFWCCTGSGMESFTKLGDSIYYVNEDKVMAAMYFSSEVYLSSGAKLRQNVSDTDGIKAKFILSGNEAVVLRLRIPSWCVGRPEIIGAETVAEGDGYTEVKLLPEKELTVKFACEVKAWGLADKDNVFGFTYGPFVLSAALGLENMETEMTGVAVTIPKEKCNVDEHIKLPEGKDAANIAENIGDYMKKKDGELDFTLTLGERSLHFLPHYKQYRERYGIYWYFG